MSANREVYLRGLGGPDLLGTYPPEFITTNPDDCVTEIQFPAEKRKAASCSRSARRRPG